MQHNQMKIGGRYNWRNQSERLVYLGQPTSGSSRGWHQFALVSEPDVVWCEVLDGDLEHFEETAPRIDISRALIERDEMRKKPERQEFPELSARQARKARKAAKRADKQGD